VSMPCPQALAGEEVAAEDHTMTQLVSSGYLDRLGFEFKPARPEDMFRRPHTVLDAFTRSG
jgi:hypothetical protein